MSNQTTNINLGKRGTKVGTNCLLTYSRSNEVYSIRLRCVRLVDTYTVNSEESHARNNRAFYPHRRSQGGFDLTFDLIHWDEYSRAMNWFKSYSQAVLDQKNPTVMRVSLPSRHFYRLGVPTTGMTFGDHTGSMVFTPTISFIQVHNVLDPSAKGNSQSPSFTQERKGQTSTIWFYPDSQMQRPGNLASYLFDQAQQAAELRQLQKLMGMGDNGTGDTTAPTSPSTPITNGGSGGPDRIT